MTWDYGVEEKGDLSEVDLCILIWPAFGRFCCVVTSFFLALYFIPWKLEMGIGTPEWSEVLELERCSVLPGAWPSIST